MAERLNLSVDDDIPDLLSRMAGGERKRGEYLSKLVKGMAQHQGISGEDLLVLGLTIRGLAGMLATVQGEVAVLKATVQTWQADS